MATRKKATVEDIAVDEKLKSLYKLQSYLSEIDKIKTLRGELPLEVADLDDEIAGLGTRINKFELDLKELSEMTKQEKIKIENCKAKIERYNKQLENVRNSKEFDHLSKEVEFETLEIELAEKHIRENAQAEKQIKEQIAAAQEQLKEKNLDLEAKKKELDDIVSRPRRRRRRSGRRPKRPKPPSNRACLQLSSGSGKMHATVWVLFPFSVEPVAAASIRFRHRNRWTSRWGRRSSCANIADES